jgi:L-ascorbate metabolism protein UlaG (beta-lactamase superfamily)
MAGGAGFALEHRGHVLLVDPYVTRAPLARALLARLRPDPDAIARYVPRADAIVVSHTHFDHVLDVPEIARRSGARVFGSRSAAALCLVSGVSADRIEIVEREAGGASPEREVGPFTLRFSDTFHFPATLPTAQTSPCTPVRTDVAPFSAWRFALRVALSITWEAAELIDASVQVRNVDLLLLCVAGWTASRDLPERVGRRLAPGAVLLSHWDDFLRPMREPARSLPAMQMPRRVERLSVAVRGVKVGTLPLLGELWL